MTPFRLMVAFYKMLHILCCLDFGFFEHKSYKKRVLWKTITVLQSIFVISIVLITMDNTFDNPHFIVYLSFYFINVLILTSLNPNKTFCQLQRDLKLIDIKLQMTCAPCRIEEKTVTGAILSTVLGFIMHSIYCIEYKDRCVEPALPRLIFLLLLIILNIVYTSCTFAFYSIFCRLKNFSIVLQTEDRDILRMQIIYKHITDLTERQKSAFSPMLLLSILFTTLETMAVILDVVRDMKMDIILTPRIEIIIVAVGLVYVFSPALSAEIVATQKDKITLILHEKHMQEQDYSRQRELERFIRDVKARTLRFRLYRVIPLDASLLGMVLNFAVTYLIVIIQFAYK